MDEYIWAVSTDDTWPVINTLFATSLRDAEDRIMNHYFNILDINDDFENYDEFREYLNDKHHIALSDVEEVSELSYEKL